MIALVHRFVNLLYQRVTRRRAPFPRGALSGAPRGKGAAGALPAGGSGVNIFLNKALEKNLLYRFMNDGLLQEALTHPSYARENQTQDNERLEFLGDSLLQVVVSDYLFRLYPELDEGGLTKLRSMIVNKQNLARSAGRLRIGDYIRLGKGEEQTNGRQKESNLANCVEAVIAAIFLDSDFETTREAGVALFKEDIQQFSADAHAEYNFKGRLQEFCQERYGCNPVYRVVSEEGSAHNKIYTISVHVQNEEAGTGTGKNKKEAEQLAARDALEKIKSFNTAWC